MPRFPASPDQMPGAVDVRQPTLSRRSFLRVGASAAAVLLMPELAQAHTRTRTKTLILFLSGGLGAKEIVQPDPRILRSGQLVPAEYRGPYQNPIAAGNDTQFGEMFPLFARKTDQVSIIRSFELAGPADHQLGMEAAMLSNRVSVAQTIGSQMAGPRAAGYVLMNPGRRFEALPTAFAQYNAFVPAYDQTRRTFLNPASPEGIAAAREFAADELFNDEEESEEEGPIMDDQRQNDRINLFRGLQRESRLNTPETRRMERFQENVFDFTGGGGRFLRALNLQAADRQRFGNSLAGDMSLMGAQFLNEGAGAAAIYYEPDFVTFDTHRNLRGGMERHAPPVDRAISALIDESRRRGFTLVITTEFSRTPRMNANAGRDHHPKGVWAAFCGPNVREGFVLGSVNYLGETTEHPVPQQQGLPNTILHASGFTPPPGQAVVTEISR